MIRLVYLFLINIILIQSKALADLKCLQDTFDVTVNETVVIKKALNITFFIKVKNIQVENESDYISDCFKSILIKYKAYNSNKTESNEIKVSNKTVQRIQLLHLSYLSSYQFDIAYKQFLTENDGNKTEIEVESENITINTCFSEPEHPKLTKITRENDGSMYYEWEPVQANDAPYICYYNIIIADFSANKLINFKTNQTRFKTNRSDNLHFYISAINSVECYINEYSFADECKIKQLESNIYVSKVLKGQNLTWNIVSSINFNNLIYSLSSTTQSTTTLSKNSSTTLINYLFYSLLLPLFSFQVGRNSN